MSSALITNALTVDVEDYFQVSAFAPNIPRSSWESRECRVERNVERILELLAATGAKATFFTLGWIAQRYPGVVRSIVAGGQGYVRVRNESALRFELVGPGLVEGLAVPKGPVIAENGTSLLEIDVPKTTEPGRRRLQLPYTITNLMVAPGEGLSFPIVVEVEVLPAGR